MTRPHKLSHPFAQRALALLFILALAFSVRALTANFLRAHIDDPGWFPSGIYGVFDRQAQNWLDGRAAIFWIDDSSHTDAAVYAPGYPLWLALIYKLSGTRSPLVVQNVQWVLDAFSVILIIGVGVTAYGWRVGLCAGGIAGLWPLLVTYGSVPLADAPTSWIILGATWMLLIAAKRKRVGWALGAGALIGASCWLRANAMLLVFFWALAIFFTHSCRRVSEREQISWRVLARLNGARKSSARRRMIATSWNRSAWRRKFHLGVISICIIRTEFSVTVPARAELWQ